ncbi:hypothetical protein L6164_016238 [Bauhinia variegata]|uniref:Uncharacterized protein n=1 Tax=Bauhinia variegata TaxID=167791 RepID=A0ACB9NN23_BAUVA|nr:hypothetical protein L6164_016238 [Bauhinia variegata]
MSSLTPIDLQRIFEKLDINGDGSVSLEELNWLLEKMGFRFGLEELESIVGKESLDLDEFVFFYNSILKENSRGESEGGEDDHDVEDVETDLLKAFRVFDLDGDGFITSQELESVLRKLGYWDDNNGKDCRSMICVYDTNLDGRLDFEEFKNMMLLTTS